MTNKRSMLSFLMLAIFGVYLLSVGGLLQEVLVIFFHFKRTWQTHHLATFFGLVMVSAFSGLSIVVLGKMTPLIAVGIGLVVILVSYGMSRWAHNFDFGAAAIVKVDWKQLKLPPVHLVLVGIYTVLAALGFYFLAISHTHLAVTTPWQAISKEYIYVFCLATFILGMLIMTHLRSSWVLVLLMVHSFLLYSYLPLTQEYLYGADGWRHVAVEGRLLVGESVVPPVITDGSGRTELMRGIGSLAYSQLWGLTVLVSNIAGLDLVSVNRWLMPVLWALSLPVLLFEIGKTFGLQKRTSLVFAWLSFLPFALQAGGSFTLPVNLGFLFWLGALLLVFKRAESRDSHQLYFLFGMGAFLALGYTLFALLFWGVLVLYEVIAWKGDFNFVEVVIFILIIGFSLPFVEWVFGYGGLLPNLSLWDGLRQMGGTLTGFYLASGPRPHDISAGNILLNEAPNYSFVANAFVANRWWLFLLVCLFWVMIFIGLHFAYKKGFATNPDLPGNPVSNRDRNHLCVLFALTLGLLLAYGISRYWLPGEHLLARRLDATLAFLLMLTFVLGAARLPLKRAGVIGVVCVASVAIAASYSLGPDTNTVSADEYEAMKHVAFNEMGERNHCVIAKTYPLLVLETLSNNTIVGGGFPISHNFEQPELTSILKTNDVSILDVRRALQVTGSNACWILSPTSHKMSYYILQGNVTSTPFGSVTLWRYKR